MDDIIRILLESSPEQFMEGVTNKPIIQSEKDVIQYFRDLGLKDEVVNTLLHYMLFMDPQSSWAKLSKIGAFFMKHNIDTVKEAIETLEQLQEYEENLKDR